MEWNKKLAWATGTLIGLAAPALAQCMPSKNDLPAQDQRLFDETAKKWVEAFNNKDAAAVASFYTEDGVRVMPSGIVQGRAAIQKAMEKEFQAGGHDLSVTTKFARISGSVTLAGGEWRAKYGDQTVQGYWSNNLVHEGDELKWQQDTFNLVAPVTAQTAK